MKNDSPLFSGGLFGDSWFDHNGDGKLSGLETIARDAYHMHIVNQLREEADNIEDKDFLYADTTTNSVSGVTKNAYAALQYVQVDMDKANVLLNTHLVALKERMQKLPADENGTITVTVGTEEYQKDLDFYAYHIYMVLEITIAVLSDMKFLDSQNVHIAGQREIHQNFKELQEMIEELLGSVLAPLYPDIYEKINQLCEKGVLPDIFLSPQERPSVPEKPETPKEEKKPKENRPAAPQMTEEEKRQKEIEAEKKRNKKIIIWTAVAIVAVIVILLMAFFESFATAVGLAFCVLMILVIGAGVGAFLGGGAGALIGVILSIFIIMITFQ